MLLMAMVGAIAACQPSPPPQAESPAPAETTQPEPEKPASSAEPTPVAPSNTSATLPNALIGQWQPLSNVLVAFGTMTVTPDRVQWSSGQSSPYRLISTEGGYLLELEPSPSFYDTQNQYIKLVPKADTNDAAGSLEVAFYSDASQLKSDEYIMYGSYFAE
ncbi:MAG: hypothetical protein DCF17_18815 [Shackletoniella antarctica]|uniref:Lipocalin-like domain-containing protein n=1 Tax=Shackletoniella antarctica TaxID=268115 RepID=A0A2W4VRA4_9CYAN|nr:MAG: hypothetical protein DCF17_18815 [Shackletoniella antarctica]